MSIMRRGSTPTAGVRVEGCRDVGFRITPAAPDAGTEALHQVRGEDGR